MADASDKRRFRGNGDRGPDGGTTLKVVLIESEAGNLATLRHVVSEVQDAKVSGEAERLEDGYREVMKGRPDVVIMELRSDQCEQSLALAERLGDIYPDTALFVTSAVQSPELMKRAMRAGVREYLGRPVDASEVLTAVRKFLRHRAQAKSARRTTGQIIAVFGPKGGAGATFVATNIAALLATRGGGSTVLVDLKLMMGDVATFLNIQPHSSIVDVVDAGDQLDSALVEAALVEHPSGLRILADPPAAEDAERVEPQHIGQLLIRLKTRFDFVVADLGHQFDGHTLEALDLADHVLLVTVLEVPAIRNTRRCLEMFERLGYDDERLKLIVSRHVAVRGGERFERSLGHSIFWRLPNDYNTAVSAINAGVPVYDVAPHSELAISLRGLAARLSGQHGLKRAPQRANGGRLGILRRLLPA